MSSLTDAPHDQPIIPPLTAAQQFALDLFAEIEAQSDSESASEWVELLAAAVDLSFHLVREGVVSDYARGCRCAQCNLVRAVERVVPDIIAQGQAAAITWKGWPS